MINKIIEGIVKEERSNRLESSDQLRLGEIISKLEQIKRKGYKHSDGTEPTVQFDFEYLFPDSIHSWRGSYDELALNFKTEGDPMPLSDFINLLKDAVGKTFTGWKGGEYYMTERTPVWVANPRNAGSTAVVGVLDEDYAVILVTGYREY